MNNSHEFLEAATLMLAGMVFVFVFLSILNKIIFKIFSPALKFLDLKTRYLEKSITSGWFLIVKKK